jgi:hypothetical protein
VDACASTWPPTGFTTGPNIDKAPKNIEKRK